MSNFDNEDWVAKKDAEFLSKVNLLIREVYGERQNPFEDEQVCITLLGVVAYAHAEIFLKVGAQSVEQGLDMLGEDLNGLLARNSEQFKSFLYGGFDVVKAIFEEEATPEMLMERDAIAKAYEQSKASKPLVESEIEPTTLHS